MRYALLGLGVSNRAVIDFLKNKDVSIFVSEKNHIDDQTKNYLESLGVNYEEGINSENLLNSDVIVVSPGIQPSHPLVKKALEKGVRLTTELDLAYEEILRSGKKIVAVTGTNGKTTTTRLTAFILSKKYRVFEGGNIGTPLISAMENLENYELIVCEVSSFQLYWSSFFKPNIGILLNIAPDHLDWHTSYEEYFESKISMFRRQEEKDVALISRNTEGIEKTVVDLRSRVLLFDEHKGYRVRSNGTHLYFEDEELHVQIKRIPVHLRENFIAAISTALYLGLNPREIVESLEKFQLLPHRFELVAEIEGVSFINDSKATNAHAVVSALKNFERKNVILILSGLGKNEDYSDLKHSIAEKCKAVVAFGAMKRLAENFVKKVPLVLAENMEEAIKASMEFASPGDVVILSPGGSSFDLYSSYVERGEDFKRCIQKMIAKRNS